MRNRLFNVVIGLIVAVTLLIIAHDHGQAYGWARGLKEGRLQGRAYVTELHGGITVERGDDGSVIVRCISEDSCDVSDTGSIIVVTPRTP